MQKDKKTCECDWWNYKRKMLSGELNIEYCDEENIYEFICLLKVRTETQEDDTKEVRE